MTPLSLLISIRKEKVAVCCLNASWRLLHKPTRLKMKLSVATFNVRGLTQEYKQLQLSKDMNKYNIDIMSIQETKIKEDMDINIGQNRLICFATGANISHGNGFMISSKLKTMVNRYWKVSDRICVVEILTKSSQKRDNGTTRYRAENTSNGNRIQTKFIKDNPADHTILLVNVYAPTSGVAKKDRQQVRKMYGELKTLLAEFKKLSTKTVIVAGDFNSKIGKRTGTETCMGKYSRGTRNQNGEDLVDFCEINKLFISNSAFKHPAKHITTWANQRKMANGETKVIYNQIDYILLHQDQKQTLINARSYAGAVTSSDHRIVVMEMVVKWTELYRKAPKQERAKQFDTAKLVNDDIIRREYSEKLDNGVRELVRSGNLNWENIKTEIKNAAEETIGYRKFTKQQRIQDPELEILSSEQQKLRLDIENTTDTMRIEVLKKKRKNILKELTKMVAVKKEREVDKIVEEIDSVKDDARMYQAVRFLNKKPPENTFVHDKQGRCVTNKQSMYHIINDHFKKHFHKDNVEKVEPFKEETPKKLNKPLTSREITKTVNCMKNNKATADIPAELIKHAPESTHGSIATVLNNMFEKKEDINIGEGKLLPLQKPKPKQVGPVKNLRPITLLTMIRKILSRATTTRIAPKTITYCTCRNPKVHVARAEAQPTLYGHIDGFWLRYKNFE